MGHNTHDDVARRWVARTLGSNKRALTSRNLHDRGDVIYSYGEHFELARILRNRKGEGVAYLLNGNRTTPTTNRHRGAVRSAITIHGRLPLVTIPYEVLSQAGIDPASVEIVDVKQDWWTTTTHRTDEVQIEQDYSHYREGDRGGWQNSRTGEIVLRKQGWGERPPARECTCEDHPEPQWKPGVSYGEHARARQAWLDHVRARHGEWDEFAGHRSNRGHVRFVTERGRLQWEAVADDSERGYHFERETTRHWLGSSLIRGTVIYPAMRKCSDCSGTGQAPERWLQKQWDRFAVGPLERDQMELVEEMNERAMERNGGIRQPLGWPRMLPAYIWMEHCTSCRGRGRHQVWASRKSYFLSGFDENETRPSYFFCELPRGAKLSTVEEAYEALKPESVKLAESLGREVARQGDVYTVPMEDMTLRELKRMGGTHHGRAYILGTNHQATDVVTLGKLTYVRGTLRHAPEGRRPDHKMMRIADGRTWAIATKNTVPTS